MTTFNPGLPVVYVAGPYTNPDPIENTHNAIVVADQLLETGLCYPFVPHQTMVWHMVRPHSDVNVWYELDLAHLSRCDGLFRFRGASSGADKEVAFAEVHGIPVYEMQSDPSRDFWFDEGAEIWTWLKNLDVRR